MKNRNIQYFAEVVKHGSFSKAAEALFVSQPTVSSAIKELEKELDVQLMIRTTRKLDLTDAGKVLLKYADEMSHLYRQLNYELADIRGAETGHVKMGVFSSVGTEILTDLIYEFYNTFPGITVAFTEAGEADLKQSLHDGELDLIVQELPKDKDVNYLRFLDGDLRLLVHNEHPFASRAEVSWSELENEKFIIFQEGFAVRRFITQQCEKAGFVPYVTGQTSQWKMIFEMISKNMGVSILPQGYKLKINVEHMGIKVLPLVNDKVEWCTSIVWKKESYLSYATRKWIEFLQLKLDTEIK